MKKYDIVVLGAGPAGISTAYTAARNGAKVLLVEESGVLGGMSTSGLLNVWCGEAKSAFWQKIKEKTTIVRYKRSIYSPEILKNLYVDLLDEAGVNVLLHTTVTGAVSKGSHIETVSLLGAGQAFEVLCDIVVDATGDGDLAASLGVNYTKGRESDGRMQPLSLVFTLGGIDEDNAVYPTFGTHPEIEKKMEDYVKRGLVSHPAGHVITVEGYDKGTASVNMTNFIGCDATDPEQLTQAELHTRRQIPQILNFLKNEVPGYKDAYVIASAAYAGVRETRHFRGLYVLTEQDILAQRVFDDWIVKDVCSSFGNHSLDSSGKDKNNLVWNREKYTIPYRSFLAKEFDNLLLCGRNISGTHMAHASYRVMPVCYAMGEGVGMAAAKSVELGIAPSQLDINAIKEIQQSLI